ncbi:coiled-coil domain-containing protein mad1 [Didymosphaeria variabile]|uniref:Spindle assembly checkpoint component MAD1 n=1 Tax=Didymosphaeria variabile TaxID=1932322 RepID=A0A9W8XBP6_9PLEO|nr:coiled-coil domain-containing protein mad1 [Didymosphaeria variabile]KAJ4346540.1 coiled-coil domain-containing protein mad1 [Didymosphaeria variabile]
MASRKPNQPSFDFFSGAAIDNSPQRPREPLRETFRTTLRTSQSAAPHTVIASDTVNEDLRTQINTLRYELETAKQDQEKLKLEHNAELRDAQNRAEGEFRKAQQAEATGSLATKKYEVLQREMSEVQARAENERQDLQKRLQASQAKASQLQEDADEAKEELASTQRQSEHQYNTLQRECKTLKEAVEDFKEKADEKAHALQVVQRKLSEKETEVGDLEAEVLRLKAITGDAETIAVIKKELSEQVAHIKKLENLTREQNTELKQYRKQQKAIQVIEEEKRTLEVKLRLAADLQSQLNEAKVRNEALEAERSSWTSYLENEAETDAQFETPEDLARAYIRERFEKTDYMNRLGEIKPELNVKETTIQALEDEKAKLQAEIARLKTATPAPSADEVKARARLERQKNLATKEVDFLRAQIKAFDDEEREMHPENFDAAKTDRIKELEDLVDQYRAEISTLQADLATPSQPVTIAAGQKRPLDDDSADERVGELRRKNRQLQDDNAALTKRAKLLESEYKAQHSQLKKLKESSRVRVLELKANPTADAEALKLSTVRTLREANEQLLAQLQGTAPPSTVPLAQLTAAQDMLNEKDSTIASLTKKEKRLKQIWSAKALEFREAVASILGWKLDFMPNGRVKVTSMFRLSEDSSSGEGEENSIVFDGEKGTMKVSGGERSAFAGEIRDSIVYWVEGRKEIPCFLAALTMEFWEKKFGDSTVRI